MPKEESAVEKALRLQQEFETTRQAGIDELLKARAEIDEKLALLGYAPSVPSTKPRATKAGAKAAEKVCKVCGEIGHDGRRHRGEKKPARGRGAKKGSGNAAEA